MLHTPKIRSFVPFKNAFQISIYLFTLFLFMFYIGRDPVPLLTCLHRYSRLFKLIRSLLILCEILGLAI